MFDWWHGCLGQQCDATLPKGVCFKQCGLPFQEEILKCDGKQVSQTVSCLKYSSRSNGK